MEKIFKKPKREIRKIFIHYSATDNPLHNNLEVIRDWHINDNEWDDIGYHYFLTKDGKIWDGRNIEKEPAAQKDHNEHTIAICLSGLNELTKSQFISLENLLHEIESEYNYVLKIFGHKDIAETKCPGFEVKDKLDLTEDNLLRRKRMSISALTLAAPFAKGFLKKLTEKGAKALLKKVEEKTGINIKTEDHTKLAMDKLTPDALAELEITAIQADKSMFITEIKHGEDLNKTYKDEVTMFSSWGLVFLTVILSVLLPSAVKIYIESLVSLLSTPFGYVFVAMGLETVGCRFFLLKIGDAIIKKYS